MMTELEESLRQAGITLWVSALNPSALEVVRRSPLGKTLGNERMFYDIQEAVGAYTSWGEASREQAA
jgi:hypothetical protein